MPCTRKERDLFSFSSRILHFTNKTNYKKCKAT
uniref:Uncharacterized protein n=1 Tax=Anguilla anguilla TaxID=7936 RepID=A0A0E9VZM1_ANGAN